MKRFLMVMSVIMAVILAMGFVSYAEEAEKPLGSSAYYVPVDSTEFELYVNQSGSLVVAGMDLIDYKADVSMYASISYKMPDGEMMVQDIRKLNAYKNNPMPCVVFEMDKYYTAFCDLYITFIDSDTLKPYVEPINVKEYFAIDVATYQANGVLSYVDAYDNTVEFIPSEMVYDAQGNVVMDYDGYYTLRADDLSLCEEYFMQQVKINFTIPSLNDYKIISIAPSELGSVREINSDQLGYTSYDYVEYYETPESAKATKIYISNNLEIYLNGSRVDVLELSKFYYMDAKIKFVENTCDKYYDVVLVTVYEHGIVEAVDSDDPSYSKLTLSGNKRVYFDFEDEEIIIDIVDKYGRDIELSDIKPGDVVAMVVGDDILPDYTEPIDAKNFKDKIKIINLGKNYISGAITEADDEYIYINGTPYSYGDFVDGNESDVFDDAWNVKLGTEGRFYLSLTGKIIGFDGSESGSENYGYILQTNYDNSGFASGWEIKLLTQDGIGTYELNSTVTIDDCYFKAESLTNDCDEFNRFCAKNGHQDDVESRIISYALSSDGKIKKIDFVGATSVSHGEFRKSTYKINDKVFDDNFAVFDISYPDADDTRALNCDAMIDRNEYAGYVAVKGNNGLWNVFIAIDGQFDIEESGDDDENEGQWNYGYILQTNYDDSGFAAGWEIKMLTEAGIAVYNPYTTIELDGVSVKSESLTATADAFKNFTGKNDHRNNVDGRIVEYKLSSDGRIKGIDFVGATAVAKDDFNATLRRINGKTLSENVVVFNICSNADNDSEAYDISYLVDGNEYAGYLADDFDGEWGVFVVTEGEFKETESDDEIPDDVLPQNYGYILQTNYDNGGFTACWEIKLLTEAGIGVYELAPTVNIDGVIVKSEHIDASASYFRNFTTKNGHQTDIENRIIKYNLASDGRINVISFAQGQYIGHNEYNSSELRLGDNELGENAVIFDIQSYDADDTKAYNVSGLVDGGEYAGCVADSDGKWNVFVVTEGSVKFNPKAGLMYVESVSSCTYGSDEALKVNYYTNGDSNIKSAIFVDTEANCVTGDNYYDLSKGDIFLANMNSEGVVTEYVIAAQLSGRELELDMDAIKYLEYADEDVAFAYGYIKDIDAGGNVVLSEEYITPNSYVNVFNPNYANQYHFNVKVKKPTVEVGAWDKNGVDVPDGDVCYYIFAEFYDGEAVDVYSIGYEREIPYNEE